MDRSLLEKYIDGNIVKARKWRCGKDQLRLDSWGANILLSLRNYVDNVRLNKLNWHLVTPNPQNLVLKTFANLKVQLVSIIFCNWSLVHKSTIIT